MHLFIQEAACSWKWLIVFTIKGKEYQGSRAGASEGRTHHASERTGSHGVPYLWSFQSTSGCREWCHASHPMSASPQKIGRGRLPFPQPLCCLRCHLLRSFWQLQNWAQERPISLTFKIHFIYIKWGNVKKKKHSHTFSNYLQCRLQVSPFFLYALTSIQPSTRSGNLQDREEKHPCI